MAKTTKKHKRGAPLGVPFGTFDCGFGSRRRGHRDCGGRPRDQRRD